jgi:hypothetical protein
VSAERARRIATALAGAWRDTPPPLSLSPAELAEVAPLLLATGAAGIAWWRVRQDPGLRDLPAALELRQAYRLQTLRAAVTERLLHDVLPVLRSAGVEPLLAKGWAAGRLYPEPGLRPCGDIDLYVPPEQHAAALGALASGAAPPAPVDLHRGFSDLDDCAAEELHARSRQVSLDGVELRLLGSEDHLRLLCLHLLRHGAWRPLWLCDVAVGLEARPPDFDWDLLLHGDRRRGDAVACALGLASRLLGARVEGTPVAGRAERLPSWLVPTVLRQWEAGFVWREPMAGHLRRPAGLLGELRRHWPNPIEGTIGVGGPFNELPRLPFQVAFTALRTARFALGGIRRVQAGKET